MIRFYWCVTAELVYGCMSRVFSLSELCVKVGALVNLRLLIRYSVQVYEVYQHASTSLGSGETYTVHICRTSSDPDHCISRLGVFSRPCELLTCCVEKTCYRRI